MLYILTVHFNDKWIDIQKRQLERFISEPYKVYTRLGDGVKQGTTTVNYEKNKHKFDGAISGAGHVSESFGKIIDYITKNEEIKSTDKILLLDSDAFPIVPISDFMNEKLKEYPFIAVQEPMHEWDRNPLYIIPHYCFMMFKAKHILEDNLTDCLREIIVDKNSNWWYGIVQWLTERGYDYYPLTRSNKEDLHELYYGIYNDMVYHHWAGSRNMITRPDRMRAQHSGEDVEDIAKENHEVSNQVFERVSSETDIDNMMAYLKGEYEENN